MSDGIGGMRLARAVEMTGPGGQERSVRADRARFVGLYRRYVGPVHRYVYSRVSDGEDADDITAQVFADAFAGWSRYREEGQFAAWLFRIARRRCADHYRRGRPPLSLGDADLAVDPIPGVETEIDRRAVGRQLREVVGTLDQDKQELLRLRFAAGLTYVQIGTVLGRQPAAVKMAVHRVLDRMAEELEVVHDHAH